MFSRILSFAFDFALKGLIDYIQEIIKKKEGDNNGPELTRRDVIKYIQSERLRFRGVNFSQLNLSKLVSIQFRYRAKDFS